MTNATGLIDRETLAILTFTTYGIILARKNTANGDIEEYAIQPESLTNLFSIKPEVPRVKLPTASTDILLPSTVCITASGKNRTIVDYRAPQKTAIWLEGNPTPLRVPLPGMIMICQQLREHREDETRNYAIFAVKERPQTIDCQLYHAPLVHVFDRGGTCWGTVKIEPETHPNSLESAWKAFLGSPFSNHGGAGRSQHRQYKKDIRGMLIYLDKHNKRQYPLDDLVACGTLNAQLGIVKEK